MKVRHALIPCALLAALAPAAHANLIGNGLTARTDATDSADYVYNVYYGSPMPSNGTIDAVEIYQMVTGYTFTLRMLHYTGTGLIYDQYYVSPVLTTSGLVNTTEHYFLGSPVAVQAGDLFVLYGRGIPFTADGSTPDTFYFTGGDFAPSGTGPIDLSTGTYTGNRVYSAAVEFTPASGGSLPVPEPGSAAMAVFGVVGLVVRRKR